MEISVVTDPRSVPGWNELCAESASNPFSSSQWYDLFLDTIVSNHDDVVCVIARHSDGKLIAALPLWRMPKKHLFSGKTLASLANYYTCLYEPLLLSDPQVRFEGLDAILDYLAQGDEKWDSIDLRPLAADNEITAYLNDGFRKRGFWTQTSTAFGNWYLDARDLSFDDYFASRRKKMRSTIRSKTKQMSAKHDVSYEVITSPEHLTAGLSAYEKVYHTSWKQVEPFPDFIPNLASRQAADGSLRLGVLRVDNEPVAAQLWFVHSDAAYIFKLAYDPEYSKYSVGTLLTMHLVDHVMTQDGVSYIDFLSGDDEYKAQWMSDRRERLVLEVLNPRSLRGMSLICRRKAAEIKKRFLKR